MNKGEMLNNIKSVLGSFSNEYYNFENTLKNPDSTEEMIKYLYKKTLRFQKLIAEQNLERFTRQRKLINNYLFELELEEE